MSVLLRVIPLLVVANVFMTFAWYGHLKHLGHRALWIAILASWGIAFFEYVLQVPANRIGATQLSLAQLKVTQEVVTLVVFTVFSLVYFPEEKLAWNHAAAFLCVLAAVVFVQMK